MFKAFSPKQLRTLCWWCPGSGEQGRDAIICDGAVRSGKTLCLSLSFVLWSMAHFQGESFALCGKTIISLRRNLVVPLLPHLQKAGFHCREKLSQNLLLIRRGRRENRFFLFGGKDEGSGALIQGVTLAGVLFDEVALMPRSFVEQALARCSVQGSRFWFSCNPQHPQHWFYLEWILRAEEKNALYLHFTMDDNPSLSPRIRSRYASLYSGAFYDRYVLGKWTSVQGAVYPMFQPERHVVQGLPDTFEEYVISCDYGTVHPASFGLWGRRVEVWTRMREYYHDSRREGFLCTDEQYADALAELAGDLAVSRVIVDPSASSFIQCLRARKTFHVKQGANQVLDGIRLVSEALSAGRLLFYKDCWDTLREFSLYRWDDKPGRDQPCKEHDHAMDDIRYFVASLTSEEAPCFAALAAERK